MPLVQIWQGRTCPACRSTPDAQEIVDLLFTSLAYGSSETDSKILDALTYLAKGAASQVHLKCCDTFLSHHLLCFNPPFITTVS